jgi:hypothetical protein
MRIKRRHRSSTDPGDAVASALAAMSADELRAFLVQALESLDDDPRGQVEDALLRQAARGAAGWRPAAPPAGLVGDVRQFITAARRIGSADPGQVDDYLREGVKASLADDSATAAALFAELLPAIGDGNIDLGQHELVDEVLSVDLTECAARYLRAVYAIAEPKERPDALLAAIDKIDAVARLWEPIAKMEGVSAIPLPDLEAFLPAWVEKLRSVKPAARDWEDAHDRRLREAVTRAEGVPGLARLARTSRRPEAARAWCEAVRETGDWKEALSAYEEAAKILSSPAWRGDFLDGAALAAERLGLQDRTERLEVAFRQAPSFVRMLRWLASDEPSAEALRKRASSMLADEPPRSARLRGVLHLVAGDILSTAAVLTNAPGLGWSQPEHPGHHLFGAFATLVGAPLAPALQPLDAADPFDLDRIGDALGGDSSEPRLSIPSFAEVLRRSTVASALTPADRAAMREAMRAAAIARVDGVLGDKHRRQYEHAAALVACSAELDKKSGSDRALPDWVTALQRRTSRFPAFQTALRTELARGAGTA